jgi:L-lactate dehydrogenase complex protein LldG
LVGARGDEDPDSRGRTEKGGTVTLLRLTYLAVVPVGRILRTVPESIEKYAGGEAGGARQRVFPHGAEPVRGLEVSLFVGMHAPGDIHVILVG